MEPALVIIEELNEKNLKWIEEHYQKNWKIFCLNKAGKDLLDFADHCETVDLAQYFFDLTETSLQLLESELDRVDPIARMISSILKLDVSTALYRYLLENYYLKKARIAKIKSLYGLDEYEAVYVDRNYVIFDGFLSILSLRRKLSKYRPFVSLFYRLFKSLKNVPKSSAKSVKLLLFVSPVEFHNSRDLIDLFRSSDVEFTILDALAKDTLYGPPQDNSRICSKFYRYFLRAICDYLRSLNSQHDSFFSYFMYRALLHQYTAQDLYHQFHPKVILSSDEDDIYQSINYHQLKKNRVVVLNFMHGEKMYMLRDALAKYDDFLVWGEYYKDLFEKLRYRGEKITIVGNLGYGKINGYEVTNADLQEIRNLHKKIISVYPQPTYGLASVEWQTQMMSDVCSYARDRADVFVLVKHHPNEFRYPTPDYDEVIGDLQNVKRCHNEYELYDLIAISDLILTPYSTVGLEAILFGKNVVYLNYGAVKHLVPYALEGSAIEISNNTEFEYYIDALLSGTIKLNQQKTINTHANGLDSQGTQRMYDHIVKHL